MNNLALKGKVSINKNVKNIQATQKQHKLHKTRA